MSASAAIADSLLRQAYRRACSPLSSSTYCFKYASVRRSCARPSRNATPRFRDEPSRILRARFLCLTIAASVLVIIWSGPVRALDYLYHCDGAPDAVFQTATDAAREMKNWRSLDVLPRERTIKAVVPNLRTLPMPIWIQVHIQESGSELRLSFEQALRPVNHPDLRTFWEDFDRKQKDRSLHCVPRGTDIGP